MSDLDLSGFATFINIIFIAVMIWLGYFGFMRGFRKVKEKQLTDVIAMEKSLPIGVPTECPKCGNSKSHPMGMVRSTTFFDPVYRERNVALRMPEHLSYKCMNCSHRILMAPRKQEAA